MYYIFVKDEEIIGKGQTKIINNEILNLEVSKDIFSDDIEKFIFNKETKTIIEDESYQKRKEEERKQTEIAKLKQELEQIDLKSIRSIRANDSEYIQKYEYEAQEIRNKIQEIQNGN